MLQLRHLATTSYDLAPEQESIRDEVLGGLMRQPKELPLARVGGFEVTHVWTDPQRLFSVQYLVARGAI